MNLRSFKSRLIVWYAVWLLTVFIVAGALLYVGLSRYLERNLAELQERRADHIAGMIEAQPRIAPAEIAERITEDFAPEASARFIRIYDGNGKVIYVSGRPRDGSFNPGTIGLQPGKTGRRLVVNGETELIVVAAPGDRGTAGTFYVESGESLMPALKELRRLLLTLGIGCLVVAVVALASGALLVRFTLKPVDEITAKAELITSRNLGERLPVPPTGDQFEHLSRALNRMITRLDEAFQHNRRFLADASHELRTPLTILRGELEQTLKNPQLEVRTRVELDNMLEEVERLAHIVDTLFELSRLEAGRAHAEHKQFDFAKLVTETTEQLCLLAEDKHLKISSIAPTPVFVEGDRARLKQVIVNLLDNAIKYTPAGGEVTITVGEEAGFMICDVIDTGIGIPREAQPQIFERFFRVDDARSRDVGGAGIGLSIVKIICAAHNGTVEVESTEKKGSRFRVRLPQAQNI